MLALPASATAKARAALGLTDPACVDPATRRDAMREALVAWQADVLGKVDAGARCRRGSANRVRMRAAAVRAEVTYAHARKRRLGGRRARPRRRRSARSRAVDKPELADEDALAVRRGGAARGGGALGGASAAGRRARRSRSPSGQAGRDLRALRQDRALHLRGRVAVVGAGVAARRRGGVRAVAAAVVDRAGAAAPRARAGDAGAGGGRSRRRLRRARRLVARRRAAVCGQGGAHDRPARPAGHAGAVGAAQLPDRAAPTACSSRSRPRASTTSSASVAGRRPTGSARRWRCAQAATGAPSRERTIFCSFSRILNLRL